MRRKLHVVAAYIEHEGRVLLDRRSAGTHLEGLWEFPGGKREAGETDIEALARELREELGAEAEIGTEIGRIEHAYDSFDLTLVLYRASLRNEPRAVAVAEIAWFPWAELETLAMPPADRPLLAEIRRMHAGS